MTEGALVQVADLTVRYGRVMAVRGANISFGRGASGLLGRNGAGKTTILRALMGLVRPAEGSLRVLGVDAAADPLFVRSNVGYMPEGMTIFPGMTGFGAVAYAGELAGLPRRIARRRAPEVLYFAGLGEVRYREVEGYSTGMVQRVKLAMALVHDPPLLFLDEPTNGLDPAGRREMLARIRELGARHDRTLILSTHILGDVEEVCSRAVLLHLGEVRMRGPISELTRLAEKDRELVVRGREEPILEHLERAGFTVRSLRRQGPNLRLRIGLPPEHHSAEIFAAVRAGGGQVRSLVDVRRSLEEVFGEMVGEGG